MLTGIYNYMGYIWDFKLYTYPEREVVRKAGAAVCAAVSCLEALNAKRVIWAIFWRFVMDDDNSKRAASRTAGRCGVE